MPEDAAPRFRRSEHETRLVYFSLPMSLNYQRNSYALWQAATRTISDPKTREVFCVKNSSRMSPAQLRKNLLRHKLALQPNKHVDTWHRLAKCFDSHWGSIAGFLNHCDHDFKKMQQIVQVERKKEFPYLSGPKIFHYWSFILDEYCDVRLKNRHLIEIAPDTHVIQSSVRLGVLSPLESKKLSRDQISARWRDLLSDTAITPIDMHSPLWFWSRNSFSVEL